MRKLLLSVSGGILCSSFTIVPPESCTNVAGQHAGMNISSTDQIKDPITVADLGVYLRKRMDLSVCNGYNLLPFTAML